MSIPKFENRHHLYRRPPTEQVFQRVNIMRALAALILFSLSSCATSPQKTVVGEEGSAVGQWRAKALVKNLRTKKSSTVDLEMISREPSQLRLEVSGTMGVYLASFSLNGESIRYILAREKRFISTTSGRDALGDLVGIRLAPRSLVKVLFDRSLAPAEWKCQTDTQNRPLQCVHRKESLEVVWEERHELSRRLKLKSAAAEVTMVVEQAQTEVDLSPDVFDLKVPSGYRQEVL